MAEIKDEVQRIIKTAFNLKVSDMYILPKEGYYQILFRYHSHKVEYTRLSIEVAGQFIMYMKFIADMELSEKRKPQLGACTLRFSDGQEIRLRLSTIAEYRNFETLVVRFLYSDQARRYYYFQNDILQSLNQLTVSKGLHIFAGSVGSGKSTTMYQIANSFGKGEQVITIEDPVELLNDDFVQLELDDKIGNGYEELIKVSLRHRPDTLIIGEVRDMNTASNVIRAALTGYRVFTTVHAKSIPGIIRRLHDFKVSSIDLEQCLNSIIFQRLLPVYCHYCGGNCSPNCNHYEKNYRAFVVSMDVTGSESVNDGLIKWNRTLRKMWLIGAISDETFRKERHKENIKK